MKMKRTKNTVKSSFSGVLCMLALCALAACGGGVPEDYVENGRQPVLSPDYADITMPVNIAPLNFVVKDSAEAAVVVLTPPNGEPLTVEAEKNGAVLFPGKEWKKMLAKNAGQSIRYDIYSKKNGQWEHYAPFSNFVSPDSIDRYLTYRLIEPSYMGTGEIGIYESDLENGTQRAVFTNHRYHRNAADRNQKCVNCHSADKLHPENKLFYYRGPNGGLLLTYEGKLRRINTRTGNMRANTGIAAWHPRLPLIAFASNVVMQHFLSFDTCKIEPFEMFSDLVLYDIEKNEMSGILMSHKTQDSYPCWSPDGKYLYYTSCDLTQYGDKNRQSPLLYNICRIPFDDSTFTWGKPEVVYDAVAEKKSATTPKISPDGRFLLFAHGRCNSWLQNDRTADLYIMDLKTMKARNWSEVNSPAESDSYHDWTGNSRWIVVSSRRLDGNYARPFFAHVDTLGQGGKPFVLPHEDPLYDDNLLKNYNVTEFASTPVVKSQTDFQDAIDDKKMRATYRYTDADTAVVDVTTSASQVISIH